jgi:CRISPR system Cascade subunit CasD
MPDRRWLILSLEGPLVAFGGVTIDHVGVTRDFPAASMLTGLIGNALGWERTDSAAHQALQDRLVFAARRERESDLGVLTDVQNAKLEKNERGWTTWGRPEGRAGASYDAPHRRRRDYHTDASVTAALRLEPDQGPPDLDAIAAALDRPARPLFIGRKPCLPSSRILQGEATARTGFEALQGLPAGRDAPPILRAIWPLGEGPTEGDAVTCIVDLPDLRNWKTGLHGGSRRIVEGLIHREAVAS